ncbi:TetR family transcriptional regulator [Actinoplanes cyaneus]|uniref:TetR family transcriptional regulator n=1 Tax=Actinoplanes cyaneus TaxID=52696 RepID=A0A919IV73_9ACTN|nr:TetR/AcrR family transcriptional regulator [Actinoplanes cyaneus]MCW2141744.1 transcriptional regulator, TetR family [Actinoplanes cyaneus]GID68650.1 TetR family transcriptional regulator [Actinoplanes cyaneus]
MVKARPLRADAQRNRDAILAAAREAFEKEGVFASLDAVAVRAGVGNATLYRNFPTREDLLAAVIDSFFTTALTEAGELSRTLPPGKALLEWLVRVSWGLRIWHDLPVCLATAHDNDASPLHSANAPLVKQLGALLDAAKAAGEMIGEITAEEVFELVLVVSWGVDQFGDDETKARRRVTLATAGIFT